MFELMNTLSPYTRLRIYLYVHTEKDVLISVLENEKWEDLAILLRLQLLSSITENEIIQTLYERTNKFAVVAGLKCIIESSHFNFRSQFYLTNIAILAIIDA